MSVNLAAAINAFRELLGDDYVQTQSAELGEIRATFKTTQSVQGIIQPANCDEVAACVRIANQYAVPLYPISRGRNWGFGSRVPVKSGSVIIDLARMNRILETSEELAYTVIEPGVTFQQLHQHLLDSGSRLVVSATGAPPDSSVIGNALERGVGRGPYGDRLDAMCNLEVVLPDGRILQTGYGRFPGSTTANLARAASGPHVDGIFTQSNLGIVTRMTIWLAPRPSNLQTFFYKMRTDEHLEEVVDVLTELRLNGFIRTPMLLGNEYRFLSFGAGYPWSASGGKTPLPASLLNDMKNRANLGAWMGEGALHSLSPAHAEADRDYLLNRLDKLVDGIEFWDESRIAGGDKSQLLPDTKMAWESNPHRGHSIPSSAAVAYWRKKTSRPPDSDLNPDRDNCGVIWFAPALPARGSDARTVTQLYENITARYGYEPNMGLLFATARCIYMTGALVYDRDQPGEDDKAMECYKELFSKFVEAGYPPYRLGIQSMSALENGSVYDDFIHQLKSVLDPNHVIAPGRYTGAEKFH